MKVYDIKDGDKVEKYHIAILFNKGTKLAPNWIQLSKATENTINLNAETEEVDYITDKNPTTLIKKYKPTMANPLIMVKGSEDYEYFWPKFYALPTGADANGECLVIFLNEENDGVYDAWKADVTFTIETLDPVNSQLTINTQFNGTIEPGTVAITEGVPTFTPAD